MSELIEETKPNDTAQENAEDLSYTRNVRRRVVDALADSAISSKDPETLNILLKAVDGIDKSAMGQMKIAQKDRESKSRENEAEVLSRALVQLANERAGRVEPKPEHDRGPARTLDPSAKPAFNKDLLEQTPSGENFAEFKSRMDG